MRIKKFNFGQRIVLWIGIGAFVLLLTHPPYVWTVSNENPALGMGHRNIIHPLDGKTKEDLELAVGIASKHEGADFGIDMMRLAIETCVISVITFTGLLLLKDKRESQDNSPKLK